MGRQGRVRRADENTGTYRARRRGRGRRADDSTGRKEPCIQILDRAHRPTVLDVEMTSEKTAEIGAVGHDVPGIDRMLSLHTQVGESILRR